MQVTAKDMLARALRATGLAASARLWFAFRPSVLAVCERMAYYITDQIKHPSGDPLLYVLLRHAFAGLDGARARGATQEHELQIAFYAGLCRALPSLMEVMVIKRATIWDPFLGEPLSEWLFTHPGAKFQDIEPDEERGVLPPPAFRAAMINFIFSPRDLAEIGSGVREVLAG